MRKSINNAFKIKKSMKLSLQEELIYSLISCYSDSQGISHISRQCLMDKSGIKKADTITKHTNRLQELGLLEKTYEHKAGKKLVTYKVINPQKDYIWVSNSIWMGNPSLACFLIKLAELKLPTSQYIQLSKNEIIKKLGIGKSTFYKYFELGLQADYISIQGDRIYLSEELFPVFKPASKISTKSRNRIQSILNNDNSRAKKTLLTYYNPNTDEFEGLKGSIEDFLDYCLAGVRKREVKQEIKLPKINFNPKIFKNIFFI